MGPLVFVLLAIRNCVRSRLLVATHHTACIYGPHVSYSLSPCPEQSTIYAGLFYDYTNLLLESVRVICTMGERNTADTGLDAKKNQLVAAFLGALKQTPSKRTSKG